MYLDPDLADAFKVFDAIRADMTDEYCQPHNYPWVVGFSGGKDSTLVVHLVFDVLLALAPADRKRPVHIVSNDTLVESPLVIEHIARVQEEIKAAASAWRLPVHVVTTRPENDRTFWVNLIGRGYPTPNRKFRWCTDRMKIQPTSVYIKRQVAASGRVILLLGVLRAESAARARTVARYDNGQRLNPHNDIQGCQFYRPIVELSTDTVWEFLASVPPPWGGSHQALIQLYRDASGGDCPVVTQKSDIPSCGTTSSRFGCWTCTVVEKDRSLEGIVASGFKNFKPLLEFRDWLMKIRNDPEKRSMRRRGGRYKIGHDGKLIPGPFTLQARMEILDRLLQVQDSVGMTLISDDELRQIRDIWARDALDETTFDRLLPSPEKYLRYARGADVAS